MKKLLILMILTILTNLPVLAECGCGDEKFVQKSGEVKANKVIVRSLGIQTQIIKEQDVDEIIKTTGQIEPVLKNEFEINSPVQGIVRAVFVNLGDVVNQGQSILQIESPEISRLSAEIKQYEAEVELAKSNFEREEYLFEEGISAKKELEASKALFLSVEAKLIAAKNNLSILAGEAEKESGVFNLRSRKRGTIVEGGITAGEIINVNQILFKAVDLSTVWAGADIYEKDQRSLALGQKATVIVDGDPEKSYEGKVTYVGSVINNESRTLPVKVTIQNPYAGTINKLSLKPGAYIQMFIHTGKKKKSIVIPRTALVEGDKEGTEGKHDHLVYIKKEDKFIPRKIQVESHDSNYAEVLSGLNAGDVVVINGAYQLQYGEGDSENFHDIEHGHEPEKQDKSIPTYWVIGIGVLGLFIGILIGRRKK